MVPLPTPLLAAGIASLALALLLPLAAPSRASDTATWQTRLARDSQRVVDATAGLADSRAELARVREEHERLHADVEARVVAMYKSGGSAVSIAQAAGADSVREMDQTIDALDTVARHESRELDRWTTLGARAERIEGRIEKLEAELADARADVRADRKGLAEAEAAAEAARERAAELARRQDSPLVVHAVGPEAVALATAEATDDAVEAEGGTSSAEEAPDEPAEEEPASTPSGFVATGEASMYHDSFTGELTASGERYDPDAFTAAHPSLPMGTWVSVQGAGGTVSVRINDRGPYAGGRIIDLSRAAANAIALPGIGQVTITVTG